MGVFGETCLKTDIFALPFGGAINGESTAFSKVYSYFTKK